MYHKMESTAHMQWTDDGRCLTAPPVRLALETCAAQGYLPVYASVMNGTVHISAGGNSGMGSQWKRIGCCTVQV